MKISFLPFGLLGFSALLAIGCAAKTPTDDTGSTDQAASSDVLSIVPRSNGIFDVTCKDEHGGPNYIESRTQAELSDASICSNPPAVTKLITADSFNRGSAYESGAVYTWTNSLWDGYVSFQATPAHASQAQYIIVDGTGAKMAVDGGGTRFARLQLPVTIQTGANVEVQVVNVSLEVDSTKAPPSLHGSYQNDSDWHTITTFGSDLAGATLHFNANATFFKNFTNGNDCETVELQDKNNKTVVLSASAPATAASLVAPVTVLAGTNCISTRLGAPENSANDYTVEFRNLVIDNALASGG